MPALSPSDIAVGVWTFDYPSSECCKAGQKLCPFLMKQRLRCCPVLLQLASFFERSHECARSEV